MKEYESATIPFQNITNGASKQGLLNRLELFLEAYLPDFPSSLSIGNISIANEEDISESLYKYLQRKRKFNKEDIEYPFEFQPEVSQRNRRVKGRKRRIDIGVRINTLDINMDLVYCIEAKRLPTDKSGGDREKEYVLGNYGGINRFKKNNHGLNDEGAELHKNSIVGYVQKLNFDHWHVEINKWISTSTDWGPDELLNMIYCGKSAKLESTHLRDSGEKVDLIHFWLNMQ